MATATSQCSHTISEHGFLALYAALPVLTATSCSTLAEKVPVSFFDVCLLVGAIVCVSIAMALVKWSSPGGPAWGLFTRSGRATGRPIPGPRGLPFLGSLLSLGPLAHRALLHLSQSHRALPLLALSLGSSRLIVASLPSTAKEILSSPCFADRPLKESARQLLFHRAIGFAPYGEYWRKLRRIAASHLFSPRRIAEHEVHRLAEVQSMIDAIIRSLKSSATVNHGACQGSLDDSAVPEANAAFHGSILLRPLLQQAALNNVMITVFGKRYDFVDRSCMEAKELQAMVREGFDLLGAFNLADHLPALRALDPERIKPRCEALVPRVNAFVSEIIRQHRQSVEEGAATESSDFVYVLLGIQQEEGLSDADIIAILWEMIFRGTDSVAILLEWILAELVKHPEIQQKLAAEVSKVVSDGDEVRDTDIARLPYLQAVVYETLRLHPPGPLLSWARMASHDTEIAGHHIPARTTAMVNMWAISHDPAIWSDPLAFTPERFVDAAGAGPTFDVRGGDLRLAPFGAGRRVCPGRAMGLATVNLWLARLVQRLEFTPDGAHPVDLTERLKLSCEMKTPLVARVSERAAGSRIHTIRTKVESS